MKIVDYRDPKPIYEQIADYYKHMILKGVLLSDEQLPSVRSLAMDIGTNPNTVQKAFTLLESEGYIYAVKGRGNFVKAGEDLTKKKSRELTDKLKAVFEEAKSIHLDVDELIRKAKEETAK